MNLWREADFLNEPCVFVGVHVVQWHHYLDQPTVGFVEADIEELPEVQTLRTRVAELEADAKLGRMVRDMPEGAILQYCKMTSGRAFYWYSEPAPEWGLYSARKGQGDTPEVALEAARKGEG